MWRLNQHFRFGLSAVCVLTLVGLPSAAQAGLLAEAERATADLLEDNAEVLLPKLTNPTGDPGQGFVEKQIVFSGKSSVKIIPMQRFHPGIPGWKFRITEKPKPGEYRYVRFAWKADGNLGIMVQFHDKTGWNIRYTAGKDKYGWGSKFVAPKPSSDWVLVTRDLYKDFGERTIQGIALTAFDGKAAYFDHIYFGRSIDDLDRINATVIDTTKPLKLEPGQIEKLWKNLNHNDASQAYRAFWQLVASADQSIPLLKKHLTGKALTPGEKQIDQWIRDLDDEEYAVREAGSLALSKQLDAAEPLLRLTLRNPPSAEVRFRIEKLLAKAKGEATAGDQRIAAAVRALAYMQTKAAKKCLEELAKGEGTAEAALLARAALAVGAKARD